MESSHSQHESTKDRDPGLRAAMDQVYLDGLSPISVALALVFFAFAIFNSLSLPGFAVRPVVAYDVFLVIAFTTLHVVSRRGLIRANWVNPLGTAIALLVIGNILLVYYLVRNPINVTHLSMAVIGSGCLLLSRRWLFAVLACGFILSVCVAAAVLPAYQLIHFTFNFFAASALAVVIQTARLHANLRLETLNKREELQKIALEAALDSAERELTERKLAEGRYRDLVQGVDAIVWEADATTWQFTFVSDHAAKVLGYPARQWMEEENFWVNHLHPEDRDGAVAFCMACTQEGRDHEFEYRAIASDGRTVWLRDIVRVVKDSDGGVRQLRGLMVDTTEGREAEEEKLKLEGQLRQSQKMEAIGTLAGGVAHDFNNLLAGILGYADMLRQDRESTPRHLKAAEVIFKAAERAAQLTKQLLGFARKGKLQIASVNLNETIQEVLTLLSRTIDKKITIRQVLSGEAPLVNGDPDQIQQIILNLAINARDALPNGGNLTFETSIVDLDRAYCQRYTHARPGRYALLSVSDNGDGIAPEIQERIFEPFFTTKAPGQGTGMGLAMVYGIVKNHSGTIQVYSEPGHGTQFKVYLPYAIPVGAEEPEPQQSAPAITGSGKILVVDDEETVREMASDMLRDLGYEVYTAHDGDSALELYREIGREIDLVIMDMIMPKLDGRGCFRALREMNPSVKAILSTGFSCDGTVQEILDEGMLGFTQKPYRIRDLSEAVAKALA